MTDKEKIEEIVEKVLKERTDIICIPDLAKPISEALCNSGYHKTIWHKVANGDLPEEYPEVRFVTNKGHYFNGVYVKITNAFYCDGDIKYDIDEVIAWIELPEYKED